jgi:hypothetical protein
MPFAALFAVAQECDASGAAFCNNAGPINNSTVFNGKVLIGY